jgi:hypothetical protein
MQLIKVKLFEDVSRPTRSFGGLLRPALHRPVPLS